MTKAELIRAIAHIPDDAVFEWIDHYVLDRYSISFEAHDVIDFTPDVTQGGSDDTRKDGKDYF